jgi:hypothetical protein
MKDCEPLDPLDALNFGLFPVCFTARDASEHLLERDFPSQSEEYGKTESDA